MGLQDDFAEAEAIFFDADGLAVDAIYKPTKGSVLPCKVVIDETAIGIVDQEYGSSRKFEATILISNANAKKLGKILEGEKIQIVSSGLEWVVVTTTGVDEIGTTIYVNRQNFYKAKA